MHSFADATPAEPVWRAHVAALQDTALQDTAPQDTAPQDTDATVLLLVSRDTGLASALLDGTFPGALRLHMVRTPAAALAFLARHSPDAVVLDAATCLPEEPRLSGDLAFVLRRRNVPLVVATPAGRAAQAFLRTCAGRAGSGGRLGEHALGSPGGLRGPWVEGKAWLPDRALAGDRPGPGTPSRATTTPGSRAIAGPDGAFIALPHARSSCESPP